MRFSYNKLYECVYCLEMKPGNQMTKDHFIPKSRGGKDIPLNYVAACKECNMVKGNRIYFSIAQAALHIKRKKELIIDKYGSLNNRFKALKG